MKITTYTHGGLQFSDTVKDVKIDIDHMGMWLDGTFIGFKEQEGAILVIKLEDEA